MTTRRVARKALVGLAVLGLFLGIGMPEASAAGQAGANNFSNAPLLPPGPSVNTGHNAYASVQAGEPEHAGSTPGATVWWRYRRGTTRTVRMSLQGSNFDTVLAVYRGSTLTNLTEVDSNDDFPTEGLWSRVQFTAQANVTYRIVVGGYGAVSPPDPDSLPARGAYKLTVSLVAPN